MTEGTMLYEGKAKKLYSADDDLGDLPMNDYHEILGRLEKAVSGA